MLFAGVLASAPAWADCANPDDVQQPSEDCDGDGWKVSDGDCDDDDLTANPGGEESCEAPADEDCNGFFDDGCDRALQRGSLEGGSACDTADAPVGWLLAVALVARRRRC